VTCPISYEATHQLRALLAIRPSPTRCSSLAMDQNPEPNKPLFFITDPVHSIVLFVAENGQRHALLEISSFQLYNDSTYKGTQLRMTFLQRNTKEYKTHLYKSMKQVQE
jgi:hypothetical protein